MAIENVWIGLSDRVAWSLYRWIETCWTYSHRGYVRSSKLTRHRCF